VETADRAELIPQIRKYFSATIIITWIVWLPALLIRNYELVVPIPYDVFIKIGSFVPTLVALFLIYKYDGSEGIRLICRSLINFRIRIEWLFFIFLVLPGVLIASYVILRISGGNLPRMGIDPRFIPIAFLYVLIFLGPLGEEIGWRGFALKRILRNTPPIQAAIFVGTIWSIWHLPLFLINGTTQNALAKFGLLPAFFGYMLYTVMLSILITLLFVKCNANIFGSILFHTVSNLSQGVLPLIFSKNGAMIELLILCMVTAGFVYGFREIMFSKTRLTGV
jgi:membrane protease YdiL (CAAX protease family)